MALKFWQMIVGGGGDVGPVEKPGVKSKDIPVEEKSLWELGHDLWRAGHDWGDASNYYKTDKGIIDVLLAELSRRDMEVWHREQLIKELQWKAEQSERDWLRKVEPEGKA
jgi:hypothetical protein